MGRAERDLLGVVLDNDIRDAPIWQLVGLTYLLIFLILFKPTYSTKRREVIFWILTGILAAICLAEVTWIPLLTTIIYTRTSYPYLVVVPHCIAANASYRSIFGDDANRLQALMFGFFFFGFGGSIVSDILVGLPATALGHDRIIPCHILGWYLVWSSPRDWVYKSVHHRKDSFIHYFILVAEAVDAVTTPMGRIARASRELQNKSLTPLAAGLLAGIGGGMIRYMAGIGSMAAIQNGFYKTMGYSLLFWYFAVYQCNHYHMSGQDLAQNHCASYNGSDSMRMVVVSLHVIWEVLCDTSVVSGHPFIWLGKGLFHSQLTTKILTTLQFGPLAMEHGKED